MIRFAILLLAVSGCAPVVQTQPQPVPGVAPGGKGIPVDVAMFPECQAAAEFVFAGEATLAALGLGEMAGGPDATRPGMIWVTAGPLAMDVPPGGGKGFEEAPAQRMVCVQWPDGSGMSTTIPDEWELPADVGEVAAAPAGAAPLDLGPIAFLVAVIVLVGASVLAFRGEGRRSAGESSPG